MKNYVSINIRCSAVKKDKSIEGIILNCHWPWYAARKAYEYSRNVLKKRWPKGESVILKCPHASYLYARYVIGKRWKKAEEIISTNPRSAYLYAKYVLKRRFIVAENKNNWDCSSVYLYSKYLLKKRWTKHENKMFHHNWMTHDHWLYIRDMIKGRWKKAENLIVNSRYIGEYINLLSEKEKEEFMFRVTVEALNEKDKYHLNYARQYIESQKQKSVGSIA